MESFFIYSPPAAVRFDLHPHLSSSAFTRGERETGSVRNEAAWFSHHPPLAPAADGLICSLKPRSGRKNYFFIFLLRRQGEGSPGGDGREGGGDLGGV